MKKPWVIQRNGTELLLYKKDGKLYWSKLKIGTLIRYNTKHEANTFINFRTKEQTATAVSIEK